MNVRAAVSAEYEEGDYRDFWRRPSQRLLHDAECALLEGVLPRCPGWFIDIGCGFGRLAPLYVGPERPAVLLDGAPNLLAHAAEQLATHDNVHIVAGDAEHMPFRDSVFASGLCVRMFHHLDSPATFLRELARVLRPGAPYVLSYSNKRNLLRIFRHGRRCFEEDHERYAATLFGTHPRWFAGILANAGLTVERTSGTGFVAQFSRQLAMLDPLLARAPMLGRAVRAAEAVADRIVGRRGLAPLHFAVVRKIGAASDEPDRSTGFDALLACPACHGRVGQEAGGFRCGACSHVYPWRGRIIDFRLNPGR